MVDYRLYADSIILCRDVMRSKGQNFVAVSIPREAGLDDSDCMVSRRMIFGGSLVLIEVMVYEYKQLWMQKLMVFRI